MSLQLTRNSNASKRNANYGQKKCRLDELKSYVRLMQISDREKSLTCVVFNVDKNLSFFQDLGLNLLNYY